jgi:cytochrome c556
MRGLCGVREVQGVLGILWVGVFAATVASQTPTAPPARTPQPIVPVPVTAIVTKPDAFVGGMVSLTAAVDQRFGTTAFSIVQGRGRAGVAEARDVLVVAPVLTAPVEPGSYVTVIGEVVKFEPADVAAKLKGAAPDMPADAVTKYRGRPAIVATSVINTAMTDLAKRLPPPMSPEEQALSRQMKQIGPAFNALRQAVTASNAADVAAQASAMNKAFGEAAAFWKPRPHPDAIQWTEDAKRETAAIATAAGRADWDGVKATVSKVQSLCSNCHGQYRERLDDGTYRFKLALR